MSIVFNDWKYKIIFLKKSIQIFIFAKIIK